MRPEERTSLIGFLRAFAVCAILIAVPLHAAPPGRANLLHVPADLFSAGGQLGTLGVESCRIVLADGPAGSLLRVSPAMTRLGLRDFAFTLPPLEQEVAFGPFATTLRLRIPGRDPADQSSTIQSTRVTVRVVGASLELNVSFEPLGPELIGEYFAASPGSDKGGWVHVLDVEADDLAITVSFPIQARGVELGLGTPRATARFAFTVAASGLAGLALDDTIAKEMVTSAIERAIERAFDLPTYRALLATTITTWVQEGPFQGLKLREIRLQPTADGGLDLLPITISDY